MITRRRLLQGAGGLILGSTAFAGYAVAIEPGYMLDVTRYRISPRAWPSDLALKIAIIADIHACEPFMSAARVRKIAETANAMQPDLIVLLGDFNGGHRFASGPVMPDEWGEALSVLKAPLGVHSILGNHDWWHGPLPNMKADGAEGVRRALKAMGASVLENDAIRIDNDGKPFWVAGLGDQLARRVGRHQFRGMDDLSATLTQVTDAAPVVLLAHEPNVFHRLPDRVAVTLCGHTHGGQVNLPVVGPVVGNERFGPDLVYGHTVHGDRHIVISAGLGTSIVPVRFMRPPEIVELTIVGRPAVSA
ncbi:MAG: metallophosphoesterase [Hyphomicrobiales bacterium]|nr:metallophosphoesterase [Hyphomicrobiales bacterium]